MNEARAGEVALAYTLPSPPPTVSDNARPPSDPRTWTPLERAAQRLLDDTRVGPPCAVVALDDLNCDGIEEFALGMPDRSPTEDALGLVVIVDGASGVELSRSAASAPIADLGHALVVVNDLDGDGWRDLAVGAPASRAWRRSPGVVLLVSSATGRALGELTTHERFEHSFGASLDFDGTSNRLIVGVLGGRSRHNESDYGGVDVFELPSRRLVVRVRFSAEHCYCERMYAQWGTYLDGPYGFGRGVLACEDLDGDGARDFLVAAIDTLNGSRGYALSGADGHVLRIFEDER